MHARQTIVTSALWVLERVSDRCLCLTLISLLDYQLTYQLCDAMDRHNAGSGTVREGDVAGIILL